MKRYSVLAILIAGTFLLAGAVPALSEEGVYEPRQNSADPESGLGWNQFSAPPMETGSLPGAGNPILSEQKSPAEGNVDAYEIGGRAYRRGIDDGP